MYNYQAERQYIFTDEGQRQFLRIRDRVGYLLKEAGAVRLEEAISKESGSSWEIMSCVDRLVELREIVELTPSTVPGQYRVFVKAYR
jgi:hypothetical protein